MVLKRMTESKSAKEEICMYANRHRRGIKSLCAFVALLNI